MKRKKWFWGLFFLAAAVCVIALQTGAFTFMGFWSIAAAVVLAALCIDSLIDLNFFGVFIPLGLLYLIFERPLGLPAVTFWPLMFAAVLASVGASILIHGRRHQHWHGHHDKFAPNEEENLEGDDIYIKTGFNQSCKYLHAQSLEKATIVSSFGKLGVYFDQVKLSPNGADVFVDVSFGLVELYFPKNWRVVDHTDAGLGGVKDGGRDAPSDADTPVVTLRGKISFGSLEIHYV